MDDAGGCVHFITTVEEAAAAAAAGQPPRRSSDTLHVYQTRQQGDAAELTLSKQGQPLAWPVCAACYFIVLSDV
jgi:hypothetical protein